MSIEQINGNNYSHSAKSNSSAKAGGTNKSDANTPKEASSQTKQADSLSLSGYEFATEVEFTKSLLHNTRKDSLASLKTIKQKIDSGAYDDATVHQKISARIGEELSMLQPVINQPIEESDESSTISAEYKEHLLKNPEVTQKIAENIVKDLQDL